MRVQLTTNQGEKITMEVSDANMNALKGRLNAPDGWIAANSDNRILINPSSIVSIREIKPPKPPT